MTTIDRDSWVASESDRFAAMKTRSRSIVVAALLGVVACNDPAPIAPPQTPTASPPASSAPVVAPTPPAPPATGAPPVKSAEVTFADDVAFLQKHGAVHVLESASGARVALSAKYQGRVMTSGVEASGKSFGWINRDFIAAGKTATPFDNFGGEDRFWLGPEGGQYGLYFAKGAAYTFDNWQVPHAMQEGEWAMKEASKTRAVFEKTLSVTNWSGTKLDVAIERTVALVDLPAENGVKTVAYETVNKITNKGKAPWKKETGLLSIWILAMYAPSSDTRVVVPFETAGVPAGTPIVNDAYFGKVPADRLTVREDKGFLLFTADGKQRGKIGLVPARAKSVLGSYSAGSKLLTVVSYDKPKAAASLPYVNSMWEKQKAPFAGDVVNSYNDGPPAPDKPPLGGFYELETSSPGAELAPEKSLVHTHRTIHFVGEASALEPLAKKHLGVSLGDVSK